jgi:hypothetical protein
VDVNQETGELKLLVKINAKSQGAEAKKSKAVKDLKQLSGTHMMLIWCLPCNTLLTVRVVTVGPS